MNTESWGFTSHFHFGDILSSWVQKN